MSMYASASALGHCLEGADLRAELLALAHVRRGQRQRPLAHAERRPAQRRDRAVDELAHDVGASVRVADDLAGLDWDAVQAEIEQGLEADRRLARRGDAVGSRVDEEHADGAVASSCGDEHAPRQVRCGHERLLAGELPSAVACDRLHRGHRRRGVLARFAQGCGEDHRAVDHARQERGALCFGAVLGDRHRGDRAGDEGQRRHGAADLLCDEARADDPVAATARVSAQRDAEQVGLGELVHASCANQSSSRSTSRSRSGGSSPAEDLRREVADRLLVLAEGQVHRSQLLGDAGDAEAEQRDEVALHLVRAAAEGQDQRPLQRALEPAREDRCRRRRAGGARRDRPPPSAGGTPR